MVCINDIDNYSLAYQQIKYFDRVQSFMSPIFVIVIARDDWSSVYYVQPLLLLLVVVLTNKVPGYKTTVYLYCGFG